MPEALAKFKFFKIFTTDVILQRVKKINSPISNLLVRVFCGFNFKFIFST